MTNEHDLIDQQQYEDARQDKQDEEDQREVPANDLDFQGMLIEPSLQKPSPKLVEKFKAPTGKKRTFYLVDAKGRSVMDGATGERVEKIVQDTEDLAGYLRFWNRDFRLGNLSKFSGEYDYVIHYLNLSIDLLTRKYPRSALDALNRALSVLETSNSKEGRVRELVQTIRRESAILNKESDKAPDASKAAKIM